MGSPESPGEKFVSLKAGDYTDEELGISERVVQVMIQLLSNCTSYIKSDGEHAGSSSRIAFDI